MNSQSIRTNYVSEIDQFLQTFDKQHNLSKSQQKEQATYRRIYALRDSAEQSTVMHSLWEKF